MTDPAVTSLLELLRSARREEVEVGVRGLARRLAGMPDAELGAATEALCGLFFVDTHDRPDLEPVLDEVVAALAACGERVVPHLLEATAGSDVKSHIHLALTLSRIGSPALGPLRATASGAADPNARAFALYAIGKVRDPASAEALPEVLAALADPDKEVRDSAARALGKIAEVVPAARVAPDRRTDVFEGLWRALADPVAPVRAKAIRSLGKLARFGYLTKEQAERVGHAARRLLGRDEQFEWDHAYIVRVEAAETLKYVDMLRAGAGGGA
jgi:HEAT repeat protein